jgi:hypothetical protein
VPVPAGTVSTIQGRRQAPALRAASLIAFGVAAAALLLPGVLGDACAIAAVVVVTAAPLLRVGWLVFRWSQERDWRFVGIGVGLLMIVSLGGLAAVAGVGGR